MSDDVNYRELMVAKTLTREELDQEAVFAEQFEHWWDAEGQYHRAGGNDYCKTFAWWAWLNREKSKQVEIDELQSQLDNMEQCYIQAKKEWDELLSRITKAQGCFQDFYSTGYHVHIFEADEALRGDHE